MKIAIVIFPGSNCDLDTKKAVKKTLGITPILHWHADTELPDVDCIILPGGFSYGDYLRSGAMAAKSPVMRQVVKQAQKGVLVIGICNGFQVLTEVGLLSGVLMRNVNLNFICRSVWLSVETTGSRFTHLYKKSEVISVPIAHHDGNYFTDQDTLKLLQDNNQIAFRYVNAVGVRSPEANPNGSVDDIAGVLNKKNNVLGMMPHPERSVDTIIGGIAGQKIFEAIAC